MQSRSERKLNDTSLTLFLSFYKVDRDAGMSLQGKLSTWTELFSLRQRQGLPDVEISSSQLNKTKGEGNYLTNFGV